MSSFLVKKSVQTSEETASWSEIKKGYFASDWDKNSPDMLHDLWLFSDSKAILRLHWKKIVRPDGRNLGQKSPQWSLLVFGKFSTKTTSHYIRIQKQIKIGTQSQQWRFWTIFTKIDIKINIKRLSLRSRFRIDIFEIFFHKDEEKDFESKIYRRWWIRWSFCQNEITSWIKIQKTYIPSR